VGFGYFQDQPAQRPMVVISAQA
jgi:hypothetical protein